MHFCLLLSTLPHVEEARTQYDAMLALQPRAPRAVATLWHSLKTLFS
ncbi:MAG: hypothetical protein JO371_01855 [Paraburkholderia sp.]|nr:hypothetical protein [Paraburkholderia sp.]